MIENKTPDRKQGCKECACWSDEESMCLALPGVPWDLGTYCSRFVRRGTGLRCKNCQNYDGDLSMCKLSGLSMFGDKVRECANFSRKYKTWAEKIRTLSDEDLAYEFSSGVLQEQCPPIMHRERKCDHECDSCWLGFLKTKVYE